METLSLLLLLILCLAAFSFFSGVEVALVSVSRIKARSLAEQDRLGSKALLRLKNDQDSMLTTILIGTNIVNVGASAIATFVATKTFGDMGLGIATGIMTFMFLVFGEIVPKTYAATHYVRIALLVAGPIEMLQKLLRPLVWVFALFSKLVTRLTGGMKGPLLTEADLKTMVKVGYEQEVLDEKDLQIIEGVISFDDIEVGNVMTSRDRTFRLPEDMYAGAAVRMFAKTKYSRALTHEPGDQDSIQGVVTLRDIVRAEDRDPSRRLADIAHNALRTSPKKRVNKLMVEMQRAHKHMAVVEEDGAFLGVVTLEDLIEEILGEIWDELDLTPENILRRGRRTYLVHPETTVGALGDFLSMEFEGVDEGQKVGELVVVEEPAVIGNIEFSVGEDGSEGLRVVKAKVRE